MTVIGAGNVSVNERVVIDMVWRFVVCRRSVREGG